MQKIRHFFCFCTHLTSFYTNLWNKICNFAPKFENNFKKYKLKFYYHEKNLGVYHYLLFLFEC